MSKQAYINCMERTRSRRSCESRYAVSIWKLESKELGT